MIRIADQVREMIAGAAGVLPGEIELEHPEAQEHGDYSCNVALRLKGGRPLAEKIANSITLDEVIDKTEVAGPGFINIWLQKDFLLKQIDEVLTQGQNYGWSLADSSKKVIIEFTDPNPFKEFHIGHLYSNIVGEAIARLREARGEDVWRVTYQGDVGLHVAKSVWGMRKLTEDKPAENASLGAKAKFLGQAYAAGARAYEDDPAAKADIDNINKQIYELHPEVTAIYQVGKRWSLEYFDTIYNRLGTKFQKNYFESEAGKVGLELVRKNLAAGIFEESDGAVVFKGENYGLHTRVFINSAGLPTYEAKELGLAPTKYRDFPYDESIIVTGNEIDEYFRVLLKALELINPELAAKTKHISHGMVRLPEGKMSSRTGKVLTGEWLLDEARDRAAKLATGGEVDPDVVGKAAVKYALLRSGVGRDIEFDFEESVSFEGNSGPYLQYTYARTQSVLAKGGRVEEYKGRTAGYRYNKQETDILRYIYRWPEVVEEAAGRYAPNLVCSYLFELAGRYNTFYNQHSILGADKAEAKEFRLALTAAVGQVIKNGLFLLGIAAPERM